MNQYPNMPPGGAADEELIDTLIAVSVVAKRLAEKLRRKTDKEKALRKSGVPDCGRRVNGGSRYG